MNSPLSKAVPPEIRFFRFIYYEPNTGCWLWAGGMAGGNKKPEYGAFAINAKKLVYAHRFSYKLHKGIIPLGFQIHHICKTKLCVNPDHIEMVTQKENMLKEDGCAAKQFRKTHCHRGHLFNKENTWLEKHKDGSIKARHCRFCHKLIERKRKLRLSS